MLTYKDKQNQIMRLKRHRQNLLRLRRQRVNLSLRNQPRERQHLLQSRHRHHLHLVSRRENQVAHQPDVVGGWVATNTHETEISMGMVSILPTHRMEITSATMAEIRLALADLTGWSTEQTAKAKVVT